MSNLETVIAWKDVDLVARIYTTSPTTKDILWQLGFDPDQVGRDKDGLERSWFFVVPRSTLRLWNPTPEDDR